MTQIYALTDNGSITLQVKLHEVSEKCDRVELKHNLIETMNHYQGIGLSANQCGVMERVFVCLLYTSPSPRDATLSRMPSSA